MCVTFSLLSVTDIHEIITLLITQISIGQYVIAFINNQLSLNPLNLKNKICLESSLNMYFNCKNYYDLTVYL